MTHNLKDSFGFPMTDGFCMQCNALTLFVRNEEEAELIRRPGVLKGLGAVAVFACNGGTATCPKCGHVGNLPMAGKTFGPPHPVCPNCGFEFGDYDMAYSKKGAMCLGPPQVVDGEPCFTVVIEIRCDCGHVLNFDPTQKGDT